MKSQKKQKKKYGELKFGYIFLILIFVAGITFLGLSIFMPKKVKTDDDGLSTVVNETEKKDDPSEVKEKNEGDNPEKTPKQYEDPGETDKTKINASITKNEVVDGKYYLRITIYEILGEGTCKLHMETDKGDSIDRSAKIIEAGADSSSCEGFDIPTSGISSGSYKFTVTMTSGKKTGTIKGTIKI